MKRRESIRTQLITRAAAGTLAGNAAIEVSIAGGQILREEFGFDTEQIKRWMDATIQRAQDNRRNANGGE